MVYDPLPTLSLCCCRRQTSRTLLPDEPRFASTSPTHASGSSRNHHRVQSHSSATVVAPRLLPSPGPLAEVEAQNHPSPKEVMESLRFAAAGSPDPVPAGLLAASGGAILVRRQPESRAVRRGDCSQLGDETLPTADSCHVDRLRLAGTPLLWHRLPRRPTRARREPLRQISL